MGNDRENAPWEIENAKGDGEKTVRLCQIFSKLASRSLTCRLLDSSFFGATSLPALVLFLGELAIEEATLSEPIGSHAVGFNVALISPEKSPPGAVPFVQAVSSHLKSFSHDDTNASFQEREKCLRSRGIEGKGNTKPLERGNL